MIGYRYIRNLKKFPKKDDTEELRVGRTSIGCHDLPQWMHINSWCMCMPCAVGSTGDPGLRGVACTCISGQFRLFIFLIGTLDWQAAGWHACDPCWRGCLAESSCVHGQKGGCSKNHEIFDSISSFDLAFAESVTLEPRS